MFFIKFSAAVGPLILIIKILYISYFTSFSKIGILRQTRTFLAFTRDLFKIYFFDAAFSSSPNRMVSHFANRHFIIHLLAYKKNCF